MLSAINPTARARQRRRRNHAVPIAIAGIIASASIAAVGYLLWPTYNSVAINDPTRLPVSIGGTLFNVPTQAVRMKVQRHSGPQERVDLAFSYPALEANPPTRRVTAEEVEAAAPPIDRIFLSIAAHHDVLAPDIRARTIYPRYFERDTPPPQDGLTTRAFYDGSPYSNEDLVFASSPALVTRCTRDGVTPGTCLSERRVGGADLTFRFPRAWLAQWRDIAGAMDRLTGELTTPHQP